MLISIFKLLAIQAVYSCNEDFCSTLTVKFTQREDDVCDQWCNIEMCGFDQVGATPSPFTSPCISECYFTLCDEALSTNEQCDDNCNNSSCGFDWGKCGFCASGCNI